MKKKFSSHIIGLLIIGGISSIFVFPIWKIDQINVLKNDYYTVDYILEKTNLKNTSFFSPLKIFSIKKNLLNEDYISEVEVKYNFRDTLDITIKENNPIGCIYFSNNYFYINQYGYVVETRKTADLPIVEGLEYDKLKINEPIFNVEEEDNERLKMKINKVKLITNSLVKNDFLNIEKIDIANPLEIHLITGDLDIILGDLSDLDQKVNWIKEIYKTHQLGVLDLRTVKEDTVILKPLS